MPALNVVANLFSTIYNNEMRRKRSCVVMPISKLAIEVLRVMKEHGFIGDYQYVDDGRGGKVVVHLLSRVNKCNVITPRFSVKKDGYDEWDRQYLPSYSRGILIVSTPLGVMSHHEARSKGVGGVLVGYVY
ncbi:MAG: 30S ribosomal protein S8 [Candidatus Nitrosocaldus sp.]|nr:30S ribosomal protein S8 [Candidatus Nitrosocaldus sp.]MDW8275524.1 30S ribosomal protein S8 [Candidatus Nitrosocaldus sp.]